MLSVPKDRWKGRWAVLVLCNTQNSLLRLAIHYPEELGFEETLLECFPFLLLNLPCTVFSDSDCVDTLIILDMNKDEINLFISMSVECTVLIMRKSFSYVITFEFYHLLKNLCSCKVLPVCWPACSIPFNTTENSKVLNLIL